MNRSISTALEPLPPGTEDDLLSAWLWQSGQFAPLRLRPDTARLAALKSGLTVAICTYQRPDSLRRLLNSLTRQAGKPDECLLVDASPDDASDHVARALVQKEAIAATVKYFRVRGRLKGLTRQRNVALREAHHDWIVFFDDDVTLAPDCLAAMEKTAHQPGDNIVGVGAYAENQAMRVTRLWRTRHFLRIIGSLQPGTYQRSGMSVPWNFLPPGGEVSEGDWLPGASMMWRTALAREVRFCDHFAGYAQGEDLEFSLRMKRKGKLLLAPTARFQHFHEPAGRPNHYKLGYMAIYNRYYIHQHHLPQRTWRDTAWFIYAWTLDSLMLARLLLRPKMIVPTFHHWHGRLRAAVDILVGARPTAIG